MRLEAANFRKGVFWPKDSVVCKSVLRAAVSLLFPPLFFFLLWLVWAQAKEKQLLCRQRRLALSFLLFVAFWVAQYT